MDFSPPAGKAFGARSYTITADATDANGVAAKEGSETVTVQPASSPNAHSLNAHSLNVGGGELIQLAGLLGGSASAPSPEPSLLALDLTQAPHGGAATLSETSDPSAFQLASLSEHAAGVHDHVFAHLVS